MPSGYPTKKEALDKAAKERRYGYGWKAYIRRYKMTKGPYKGKLGWIVRWGSGHWNL